MAATKPGAKSRSSSARTGDAYARLWAHVEPATSKELLLAALDEFARHGYQAATTRDIAQRVGLSPAAVYVHYKSKADLLFEITRIGHEAVLAEATEAADRPDDPVERVRAFAETFTAWHARHHTLAHVTQYEIRALKAAQLREIRRLRRKIVDYLDELLESGEVAGALDVVDRPGTVTAILSLGIDVARWYASSPSPEELGALYGELVVRMVASA